MEIFTSVHDLISHHDDGLRSSAEVYSTSVQDLISHHDADEEKS